MDDKDDEPDEELKPYQLSSKQLAEKFVLLADAGAQHSVEFAWNGKYGVRPAPLQGQNPAKRARTE